VESNVLGHSYIGFSNHSKELERDRYFVWIPLARLEEFKTRGKKQQRHESQSQTSGKP
jgi:hypothetical protein